MVEAHGERLPGHVPELVVRFHEREVLVHQPLARSVRPCAARSPSYVWKKKIVSGAISLEI